MNTKILMGTLASVVLIGVGAFAITGASAQGYGFGSSMTAELAKRLNVSEDKVVDAMSEIRNEHWQERQEVREEHLEDAVEDGLLTVDQKQALVEKHEEMQTQHGERHEEMEKWFEEEGIDYEQLRQYRADNGQFSHGNRGERGLMH